jgi:tape measure domain-containing protein
MAADLEPIGLEAVFRTEQFNAGMDQYLNGIGQANQQTSAFGSVVVGLGDSVGLALTSPLGIAAEAFTSLAIAGKVAEEALQAVGGVIQSIAETGLAMNENLENTEIRLNTLTGVGEQTLKWVRDLSVVTPFTTDQLSQILSTAKAYGFTTEEAKSLTVTVGEVGAAMGNNFEVMQRVIDALGQMNTAGRVNSRDMKQLTDAGIDAWRILAEKMGLSTEELRKQVEQGKILASDAIPALKEAIDEKYGGALERASRSATALLDTLKENVQLATADVTLPLFEKFKDLLAGITDEITGPGFQGAVKDMQDLVADLAAGFDPGAFVQGFRDIIAGAREVIGFIRQIVDEVRGLSGADVLAGAQQAIEANNAHLAQSEADLLAAHQTTISNLESDMAGLGDSLTSQISDITAKYADKFDSLNDRMAKAQTQFSDSVAKADRDLGQKLQDNAKALQDKLDSLADSHASKIDGLNDRMAKASASLSQKLLDGERSLQEKLDSLAESHANKRQGLQDDIANKQADAASRIQDLQDNLADATVEVQQRAADKRDELNAQMLAATSDTEKAAIQAKIDSLNAQEQADIAKLQAKEKRDEERIKAKTDREIALLNEKIAKEDAAYQKQVDKENQRAAEKAARIQSDSATEVAAINKAIDDENAKYAEQVDKEKQRSAEKVLRIQQDHDFQIADLQKRLGEENAEIDKQKAKLQADQAKDIADAQTQNAAQVAALQQRIASENAAYDEQRAKLEADAAAENQRIITQAQQRAAAIGEGPAHDIAVVIRDILSIMQQLYDFMLVNVLPVFEQVAGFIEVNVLGALDKLAAWFDENKAGIVTALETISTVAVATWKSLTDVITGDAAPNIKAAIESLNEAFGNAGITWQDVADLIGSVIVAAAALIAGVISGLALSFRVWAQGVQLVVDGVQGVIEGFVQFWTKSFDAIDALLHLDFPRALEDAKGALHGAVEFFLGLTAVLVGGFEATFGSIIAFVAGFVGGVIDFFTDLADRLVGHSIIPDMLTDIVNAFKDIDWLGLGTDMIDGVIKGVQSAAGRLLTEMTSLATRALQAARDAVGAHSPADDGIELGVDIVSGITKGIEASFDKPISLMQALASSLVDPGIVSGARLPGGTSSVTTVNNSRTFAPVVHANYSNTQSPARITDDLNLLGAMG